MLKKKKTIILRASLYKISSKLKNLKKFFEDKTNFIIKMLKPQLMNSALKDENNGTKESETSDEYLSDFTKLQLIMCGPCFKKVCENCLGK